MQPLTQTAAERVARSVSVRLDRTEGRRYDPDRDRPVVLGAVAALRARRFSVGLVDWRAAFVANGWFSTDTDPMVDAFLGVAGRDEDVTGYPDDEVTGWIEG